MKTQPVFPASQSIRCSWMGLGVLLAACTGKTDDTDPAVRDGDGDGFAEQYDCDDLNPAVYPTADELCDGIDNNCDDIIDDASSVDATTWYADGDGDGHGNPASSTQGCTPPPGFIAEGGDCDDSEPSAHPGREEVCDGIDNDCNGAPDDDPVDAARWYADGDGDGYGAGKVGSEACSPGSGWVTLDGDCDDSEAAIYPGAEEICDDGLVNDCDGTASAARATCAWPSDLDDGDADVVIQPAGTTGQPGWSVAVGDLNADGQDDLLVGSPGADRAWMLYGPITADRDFTTARSLYGSETGLASRVSDVNQDGYDDVLTGGPSNAWVLWGPLTAGRALSRADLRIDTEGAALAAPAVGAGGDIRLAIGAPRSGAVYLFAGDMDGSVGPEDAVTLSGPANTGAVLSSAGDIDGDGFTELLVGAPSANNGGAAWLVLGPITASQSLSDSDRWTATGWSSLMGTALSGLGDLNGDGYDDFAMGAPAADFYSGAVGIWYGGTRPEPADVTEADLQLVGDLGLLFGGDINPAGDIDLDGKPDVVIGSGHGVSDNGQADVNDGPAEAYLFLSGGALSGATSLSLNDADVVFQGPQRAFGLRATGIGDVSGDGRSDLFFSSGEEEEENYLFFGPGE